MKGPQHSRNAYFLMGVASGMLSAAAIGLGLFYSKAGWLMMVPSAAIAWKVHVELDD